MPLINSTTPKKQVLQPSGMLAFILTSMSANDKKSVYQNVRNVY
jgi:hypothetical protein